MKDIAGIPERILLVEDNSGDIRLFFNEFEEIKISSKIHVANNGIEALKIGCGIKELRKFIRFSL